MANNADGYITIGTKLDTDKFDRQITELENKIKKEEEKQSSVKVKLTGQEQQLERERQKVDELAEAYERMKNAQDAIEAGKATAGQFTDYFGMKGTYGSLENLEDSFNKALNKQEAIEQKVEQTRLQYNGITTKVDEYKQKIESVNFQRQQQELEQVRTRMGNVGNSVDGIVHKVGKWALAIFSVRSAYNLIRQSISTLSEQNQDLANQISAIKSSLANALAPVVQFIVDLATKVVAVIGYILKLLFGIDIFAKKANTNIKKTTSAVKGLSGASSELKKQLAGFDEINMLNKDGSTGGLGGLGGIDDDLDAIGDKMQDMSKMGEELFKGILDWLNPFSERGLAAFNALVTGIKNGLAPLADWANVNFVQPFTTILKEPWRQLQPFIEQYGRPAWERGIESLKAAWETVYPAIEKNVLNPMNKMFDPLIPYINNFIDGINNAFGIFGIHIDHIKTSSEIAAENMQQHFAGSMEGIELTAQDTENLVNANWADMEEEANYRSQKMKIHFAGSMEGIEEEAAYKGTEIEEDLTNPLENVETKVDDLSNETIDIKTDDTNIQNLSGGIQGILDQLVAMIKNPWRVTTVFDASIGQSFANAISTVKNWFSGFSFPHMATGGIINMPNRGTMVGGSAIAGEAGREGIVPLTDQQAMAELGAEIGRNVSVNLTNITSMNGRVISRELKTIQNEQDFAYNM